MAIKRCFYLSETIGDGLTAETAWRPALRLVEKLVPVRLHNPAWPIWICYASAEEALLNLADADPKNLPISPRFDSDPKVQTWLDGASTISVVGFRAWGLNIFGLSTRRQVFQRFLELHSMLQQSRDISRKVLGVFKKNMNTNPKLSEQERNEIKEHHGINIPDNTNAREAMEMLRTSRTWRPALTMRGVTI